MLLLMGGAHPTIEARRHPNLGRLITPSDRGQADMTAAAGIPWAADNEAFQGWDAARAAAWERMLDALRGLPGCLFVTAPDVVGDRGLTDLLFHEHAPKILAAGLPAAYVLQDVGPEADPMGVPWGSISAVFIGGTDEFKLGPEARALAGEAKGRGLHVHMGRVNSERRIRYAAAIGCDSFDGTGWSKWRDTNLPRGLRAASLAARQPPLF